MGWEIAWQLTLGDTLSDTPRNFRNILPANTSGFSGSKIRITVKASAQGSATLDGCSIGLMTIADDMDDAADGTFKRVTWEIGNPGVTCIANQSKVSDEIIFAFDKTKRYGIHFHLDTRLNWMYDDAVSDGMYWDTGVSDDTLVQTVAYTPVANFIAIIAKLEVFVGPDEFVYSGDVPLGLIPDDPKGILSMVYGGDIPLVILPDFPKAILEKSYDGNIGLVIFPNSLYELLGFEFVYSGDIPLSILSGYSSILDRIYKGDTTVILAPNSLYLLEQQISMSLRAGKSEFIHTKKTRSFYSKIPHSATTKFTRKGYTK